MKKIKGYKKWVVAASALVLAACGNGDAPADQTDTTEQVGETQTLEVGASNVPHAEILEFIKPQLEEEGIDLEITTFNDYVLPNVALEEGDIDANYFQHIPYFESQVAENDYEFEIAGAIHIEPLGAFSSRHESLDDLPEGATILASSSITDHGRVISILQEAGLVTVKEGVELTDATFDDIEDNPRNLAFEYEFDPALMPTLLEEDEGDVVFINSNFAVDHDLNPVEDSIALESSSSPYANVIAVRSGDEDSDAIKTLVAVLQSEETQAFILDTWSGAVVPVTE